MSKTASVRRTLAGLLFALSYAALCVAAGGWLLQRTAFDPATTKSAAHEILKDSAIKNEVTKLVAEATASTLGQDPIAVEALVTTVANHPDGARFMEGFIGQAHAKLIGARDEPVTITPEEMVQIVRNQAVAGLPAVEVPVPRVGALNITRQILDWAVPLTAIAFVIFFLLGMTTHPDRSALVRSLGFGLLILAVVVIMLGYVVPRYAIPALTDSPWGRVPAVLADQWRLLVIGAVIALAAAGCLLLISAELIRRRRRWSTPINTYRYSEQRHWS